MIYFTSDPHLNELRKHHYDTPFDTKEQKNESIKKNWNSLVTENDTVKVIGDVGDFEFLKDLNGNIHIILGNHARLTKEK